MSKVTVSDEDKEWRAEQDVRTLIEAEEIKRDKSRHRRAIAKAKQMSKDLSNVTS